MSLSLFGSRGCSEVWRLAEESFPSAISFFRLLSLRSRSDFLRALFFLLFADRFLGRFERSEGPSAFAFDVGASPDLLPGPPLRFWRHHRNPPSMAATITPTVVEVWFCSVNFAATAFALFCPAAVCETQREEEVDPIGIVCSLAKLIGLSAYEALMLSLISRAASCQVACAMKYD